MITNKGLKMNGYNGFYIYKIENINGDYYIGATTNIVNRIETYSKYPTRIKNQANLIKSIEKFGWRSHKFEILYEYIGRFDIQMVVDVEQFYILNTYIKNPDRCLNGMIRGLTINKRVDI